MEQYWPHLLLSFLSGIIVVCFLSILFILIGKDHLSRNAIVVHSIAIVVSMIVGTPMFKESLEKKDQQRQERFNATYNEGYNAAINGTPPTACPYGDTRSGHTTQKVAWMQGWSEGNKELKQKEKK